MTKKKTNNTPERKKDDEPAKNKNFSQAHNAAEKDIEKDPDLNTKHHRGDDLDEGELARLEGED